MGTCVQSTFLDMWQQSGYAHHVKNKMGHHHAVVWPAHSAPIPEGHVVGKDGILAPFRQKIRFQQIITEDSYPHVYCWTSVEVSLKTLTWGFCTDHMCTLWVLKIPSHLMLASSENKTMYGDANHPPIELYMTGIVVFNEELYPLHVEQVSFL